MSLPARFVADAIAVAPGWSLQRLTATSALHGANGMARGDDGRIYVAECVGSRISAIDLRAGDIETISPIGSDIVAPDDLAFDGSGRMYVTEFMNARVSVREPDGRTRVLRDDLPGANGITMHHGRLFVDECRPGGRLLELDLAGGAPRVLVDGLALPNALAAGPDGSLYFPLVGADEIWRVHPDGGVAERVVSGISRPTAVKFDRDGHLIAPASRTGEILRVDLRNGRRRVVATLEPGIDNLLAFGGTLIVSFQVNGRLAEILGDGTVRDLVPPGLLGPFGVSVANDGTLYIADHAACYSLAVDGVLRCLATMSGSSPGYPGGVRGVAMMPDGRLAVTTSNGKAAIYDPRCNDHELLSDGLDEPYGVALAGDGIVVADLGAGTVIVLDRRGARPLAAGLAEPIDVATTADGRCFVSEHGRGRVVELVTGDAPAIVCDDLVAPQGIAVHGRTLFVVDAGRHALIAVDLRERVASVVATGLPVGSPPGVTPRPLNGAPPFSGRLRAFAGVAVARDGTCYVAADAEGSVIAFRQTT